MSLHTIAENTVFAVIAGVIAAITYEVIYFLTSNHHVREGLPTTAIIGASTLVIAFVLGLIFRQIFQRH